MVVIVARAITAHFFFLWICKDVISGQTYESVWANRLFFSTLFLKYAQLPLSKEVIARMFLLSLFLSLSESRADPMLLRFRGDWTWCNFRVNVSGSLHVDVCAREIRDGVNGADAIEPQWPFYRTGSNEVWTAKWDLRSCLFCAVGNAHAHPHTHTHIVKMLQRGFLYSIFHFALFRLHAWFKRAL